MCNDSDSSPDSDPDPAPSPTDSPGLTDEVRSDNANDEDEGAGCLPAAVAITLILGIIAAVLCGVTTWLLFQKRAEIAVRTLEGFVPVIEQSLLEPEDKADVINQFEALIKEMSAPDYPPASAAAFMQRIVRLPLTHWGELDAIESYVKNNWEGEKRESALTDLSRVRKAVQMNHATVRDLVDVLQPVAVIDEKTGRRSLRTPLNDEQVEDVIERAGLLAARAEVEDKRFPHIKMGTILRQEIKTARTEGGF